MYFPIRQTPPHPFQGTKTVIFQPDWADNQLENPDASNDVIQLVALQFAVHRKTITQENEIADNRMGDVIGKGHLPDSSKGFL